MIPFNVSLRGDGDWPDLKDKEVIHIDGTSPIQVSTLDAGMASGRPSVAFRVDLPDGKVVVAETSARLFCTAAKMIMAKYPDLFED